MLQASGLKGFVTVLAKWFLIGIFQIGHGETWGDPEVESSVPLVDVRLVGPLAVREGLRQTVRSPIP